MSSNSNSNINSSASSNTTYSHKVLEWNANDRSQFLVGNNAKLELCHIHCTKTKKEITIEKIHEASGLSNYTSLSWHKNENYQPYVGFGLSNGIVGVWNTQSNHEMIVHSPTSLIRRPCTGLTWNTAYPQYLAASFDKSRGQSETSTMVFDINYIGSARSLNSNALLAGGSRPNDDSGIVFRSSSEEPVASICWKSGSSHELLVGTAMGFVRMLDIRTPDQVTISLSAHVANRPRKVKGLRPDPFNNYLLATFSDVALEPVKIWDFRKGSNAKPRAVLLAHSAVDSSGEFAPAPALSTIYDVAWCPDRSNVIAISSSHMNSISLFSTLKPDTVDATTRMPLHTIKLAEPCRTLHWFPTLSPASNPSGHEFLKSKALLSPTEETAPSADAVSSEPVSSERSCLHELMISTATGFGDIEVVERTGLGLGCAGRAAVSIANKACVFIPQSTTPFADVDGSSSPEVATIERFIGHYQDIESVMKLRCRAGYGITSGKNIQILSDEYDRCESLRHEEKATTADLKAEYANIVGWLESLLRTWSWVDRVENVLSNDLSLQDCGVLCLVTEQRNGNQRQGHLALTQPAAHSKRISSSRRMHETLGVTIYASSSRSMSRSVCGWGAHIWIGRTGDRSQNEEDDDSSVPIHTLGSPGSDFNQSVVSDDTSSHRISIGDDDDGSDEDDTSLKYLDDAELQESALEDVLEIVEEIESVDFFERACALALWHGNLELAVNLLQKAISNISAMLAAQERREMRELHASTKSSEQEAPTPTSGSDSSKMSGEQITAAGAIFADDDNELEEKPAVVVSDSTAGAGRSSESLIDSRSSDSRSSDSSTDGSSPNQGSSSNSTDSDDYDAESAEAFLSEYANVSNEYVHMLSLVAMCIAGYQKPSPTFARSNHDSRKLSVTTKTWGAMCLQVLTQLDSKTAAYRKSSCYLSAMCRFLLLSLEKAYGEQFSQPSGAYGQRQTSSKQKLASRGLPAVKWGTYSAILEDSRLALEDRISFACTYLDDEELILWLKNVSEQSRSNGSLEGLFVTGLSSAGYEILQQYIDFRGDIQTAALLVSRLVDSAGALALASSNQEGKASSSSQILATKLPLKIATVVSANTSLKVPITKEFMWLSEYRTLLNTWQYFIERATLDVDLGKDYRLKQVISSQKQSIARTVHVNTGRPPTAAGAGVRTGTAGPAGGGPSVDKKSVSKAFYALPPHFDVAAHMVLRCGFCGKALPADQNIPAQQQTFLRKQCPLINCCAFCKKELPRCYVCSLFVGFVNPMTELNRLQSQRRKFSESALIGASAHDGTNTANSNGSTAVNMTSSHATGGARSATNSHSLLASEMDKAAADSNVLGFGKWLFFCQKCRHGGHSACIENWFSSTQLLCAPVGSVAKDRRDESSLNREVCGVNSCNCRCLSYR